MLNFIQSFFLLTSESVEGTADGVVDSLVSLAVVAGQWNW